MRTRSNASTHTAEHRQRSLPTRIAFFAYGTGAYVMFLGVFLYAIGFLGDFLTPTRLDGPLTGSLAAAIAVNLGLLTAFALQHSIMARPGFKRWWTQFVPKEIERSTYVLFSNLAMIALFAWWQPMGGSIWKVDNEIGAGVLYGVYALGWVILLVSTFLINHFDLFGLRQIWLSLTERPHTETGFMTPWFYRWVRHPIYVGWIVIFWATPNMTIAHLLFAVGATGYILVAIQFEERDLIDTFGDRYRRYREQVPALIPRVFGRRKSSDVVAG